MHHCTISDDIQILWENCRDQIDWREKDLKGRTAVECMARHCTQSALPTMLLLLTDEEFCEVSTPSVWGGVSMNCRYGKPDFTRTDSFGRLMKRLRTLVPRENWKSLIKAMIHSQLRCRITKELEYLIDRGKAAGSDEGEVELSKIAVESLMEPFDEASWRRNYTYWGKAVPDQPLPHLLVDATASTEELGKILAAIRQLPMFADNEDFTQWCKQRNAAGQTCIGALANSKFNAKAPAFAKILGLPLVD